jgi:DNA-binding PadR family transcriptional regulator
MGVATPNPIEFQILLARGGGARHGYGIITDIGRQSGGRVRVGPGTLYGAIRRMLGAEWIEETDAAATPADEEPDSRRTSYYRLTSAGRRAAEETARQMADLVWVAAGHGLVNLKPSH